MPTIAVKQEQDYSVLDVNDLFENASFEYNKYNRTTYDKVIKALVYTVIGLLFGTLFAIGVIISTHHR